MPPGSPFCRVRLWEHYLGLSDFKYGSLNIYPKKQNSLLVRTPKGYPHELLGEGRAKTHEGPGGKWAGGGVGSWHWSADFIRV